MATELTLAASSHQAIGPQAPRARGPCRHVCEYLTYVHKDQIPPKCQFLLPELSAWVEHTNSNGERNRIIAKRRATLATFVCLTFYSWTQVDLGPICLDDMMSISIGTRSLDTNRSAAVAFEDVAIGKIAVAAQTSCNRNCDVKLWLRCVGIEAEP